jgi:hypothetical protein
MIKEFNGVGVSLPGSRLHAGRASRPAPVSYSKTACPYQAKDGAARANLVRTKALQPVLNAYITVTADQVGCHCRAWSSGAKSIRKTPGYMGLGGLPTRSRPQAAAPSLGPHREKVDHTGAELEGRLATLRNSPMGDRVPKAEMM